MHRPASISDILTTDFSGDSIVITGRPATDSKGNSSPARRASGGVKPIPMKKLEILAETAKRKRKEAEIARDALAAFIRREFGRDDVFVSETGDGICVMFDNEDATGVGVDDFISMAKQPGFDIFEVQTVL